MIFYLWICGLCTPPQMRSTENPLKVFLPEQHWTVQQDTCSVQTMRSLSFASHVTQKDTGSRESDDRRRVMKLDPQ